MPERLVAIEANRHFRGGHAGCDVELLCAGRESRNREKRDQRGQAVAITALRDVMWNVRNNKASEAGHGARLVLTNGWSIRYCVPGIPVSPEFLGIDAAQIEPNERFRWRGWKNSSLLCSISEQ